MKVGCIILAAGLSTRFGGNKLLTTVDGRPLFSHVLTACPPTLFDRNVVVSASEEILTTAQNAGFTAIQNPHPQLGISSSIKLGLAPLLDMDGVLFAVSDQPRLRAHHVAQLVATFVQNPNKMVALSFQGRRGNPVIFPQDLFGELMALEGDVGGSNVINRHPQRLLTVDVAEAQALLDLDYPQDFNQFPR